MINDHKQQPIDKLAAYEKRMRTEKSLQKKLGRANKGVPSPHIGEWVIDDGQKRIKTTNIELLFNRPAKSKVEKVVIPEIWETNTKLTEAHSVPLQRKYSLTPLENAPSNKLPSQPSQTVSVHEKLPSALYGNSLTSLLQEGTKRTGTEPASFHPLEYYDDLTYETRTPEEWIRGTGKGYSKWQELDSTWHWKPCTVLSFDKENEQFLIEWEENKKQKYVSRLNLRFFDEDESHFMKRLEVAMENRLFHERLQGRVVRMDLKDLTNTPEMPVQSLKKITSMCYLADDITFKLKEGLSEYEGPKIRHLYKQNTPVLSSLFRDLQEEVKLGYRKTNARLDYDIRHPLSDDIPPFLHNRLNELRPKKAPKIGTITVTEFDLFETTKGEYDDEIKFRYREVYENGHKQIPHNRGLPFEDAVWLFSVCLPHANPHILKALQRVWKCIQEFRNNNKLLDIECPTLPLDDFVQTQTDCFTTVIDTARKLLTPALVEIMMEAKSEEDNKKVDRPSICDRYPKLLIITNFALVDTLRDSILHSIEKYTLRLESFQESLDNSRKHGLQSVLSVPSNPHMSTSVPKQNTNATNAVGFSVPHWVILQCHYPAVLKLRLTVAHVDANGNKTTAVNSNPEQKQATENSEENAKKASTPNTNTHTRSVLVYDPPLAEVLSRIPEVLSALVEHCSTLQPIEVPTVNAIFPHEVLVPALASEEEVEQRMARVRKAIEKNMVAAEDFLSHCREHEEMLSTDIAKYVSTFEVKNKSLSGFKFEIEKTQRYMSNVEKKLCDISMIGMFEVDCTDVKNALGTVTSEIRNAFLDLLHRQTFTELKELGTFFQTTLDTMTRKPSTPEELSEVSKLVEKTTNDLPVLSQQISMVMKRYQLLEDFFYGVEPAEFRERWTLLGWPRTIRQAVFSVEKINSVERLRMIRELRTNQKNLEEKLYSLEAQAEEINSFKDIEQAFTVGELVRNLQNDLKASSEEARNYSHHERLFEFKGDLMSNGATNSAQIVKGFEPMYTLWSTASDWMVQYTTWVNAPFTTLSADTLNKTLIATSRIATRLIKLFKGNRENAFNVSMQLKKKTDEFKKMMPLITKLRHQGVRQRHWDMIAAEVGFEIPRGDNADLFTLGFVQDLHLENNIEVINKITDVAINEYTLESALEKMSLELRGFSFETSAYKDSGTYIVHSTEDLADVLEDQSVRLQTMLTSPFIEAFLQRAEGWRKTLSTVSAVLTLWLRVQKHWMYLTPILSAPDIRNELPGEGRKFQVVDATWRKMMASVVANPKVLNVCAQENLLKQLEECNKTLESIQFALNDYLETKRARFNRFFFLSNDDLLDILAHSKDSTAVQQHLRTCFDNINRLTFVQSEGKTEKNQMDVLEMKSYEGECVKFIEPVHTEGREVELWLGEVESRMRATLESLMGSALSRFDKMDKNEWLESFPAQIVLITNQLVFTRRVSLILASQNGNTNGELSNLRSIMIEELNTLTAKVRGQLSKLMRTLIGALLVLQVHNRDIVAALLRSEHVDESMMEWVSQLRYYWEEGKITIRVMQAHFNYVYEYIGNTSRLVLTPLTDRVYHTLTDALHLNLGGAPSGPAGTGKTETTKDLAKALGKMCVIFNCSKELDYITFGRLLKGLASTGAWGCFDEFNRIEVENLSIIASQVLSVQQAIASGQKRFKFIGSEIGVDGTWGVFITMNPGYAGRSELPDNLKALFRPVSMAVADMGFIAEIMLFCEGFAEATMLSRKIIKTLSMAQEQLSAQSHYDFGMRTLKSVLSVAGNMKRADTQNSPESYLLVESLKKTNVPKFIATDIPVFMGILKDLFPEVDVDALELGEIKKYIVNSIKELGFQSTPSFLQKCVQLFETITVRHGIMVVGDPGSGKTVCYRVLAHACNRMAKEGKLMGYDKVEITIINPKAITDLDLYGSMSPTFEWTDGILSRAVKEVVSEVALQTSGSPEARKEKVWHWIMLDGPVDAHWIENLNSVLDDSKLLCLADGERISLPSNCIMIFEVMDLRVASPATVSRTGMLYLDSTVVGWAPLVSTWIENIPSEFTAIAPKMRTFFSKFVSEALIIARKKCKMPLPQLTDIGAVQTLLAMLSLIMKKLIKKEAETLYAVKEKNPDEEDEEEEEEEEESKQKGITASLSTRGPKIQKSLTYVGCDSDDPVPPTLWAKTANDLEALSRDPNTSETNLQNVFVSFFAFCVVHSIGGVISGNSRETFSEYVHKMMKELEFPVLMPNNKGKTCFDYYFNVEKATWEEWEATSEVKNFVVNAAIPIDNALVSCSDNVSRAYLMELLVDSGRNVYFVGETGTGKTMEVFRFLFAALDHNRFAPANTVLSIKATPVSVAEKIESCLLKRKNSKMFIPPQGKKLIVVLDDAHLPFVESSGAQLPLELLRQYIDHGGWYSTDKEKEFRAIKGMQFIAMGTIGDNTRQFCQRFMRHFAVFYCPLPSIATMRMIVEKILHAHFAKYPPAVVEIYKPISDCVLTLHNRVNATLLPSASKSQYVFPMQDIIRVLKALTSTNAQSVPNSLTMYRLWFHESLRVYGDRLNSESDCNTLVSLIKETLESCVGKTWEAFGGNRTLNGELPLFSDFLSQNYTEVLDHEALITTVRGHLNEYNGMTNKPMDLFMFPDAVSHVQRIYRVFKQGGHMLLLGMGGSGRQSLARIANHIADYQIVEIVVTRSYGITEWCEDLKKVLRQCGLQCIPTILLLTDSTLSAREKFMEDIDCLVHNNTVPDLFTKDDLESHNQTLRGQETRDVLQKMPENTVVYFNYKFTQNVRNNLHVVLAMSPYQRIFKHCVQFHPSVLTGCTQDWFFPWPLSALRLVAGEYLTGFDTGDNTITTERVISICVQLHERADAMAKQFSAETKRCCYVTSNKYLEFMRVFRDRFSKKREENLNTTARLKSGLDKLGSVSTVVASIQSEIEQMVPIMEQTERDCAALMETLKGKREAADNTRAQLQEEEAKITVEAEKAAELQKGAQEQLDEALPALHAAEKACLNIQRNQINEIRSLLNPPAAMTMVVEALCIIFMRKPRRVDGPKPGTKIDDYWPEARALMDSDFLKKLLNFDKESLNDETIAKLKPYINNKGFEPDAVAKINQSLKSLCLWIRAMEKFFWINKAVRPKKLMLEEANQKLAAMNAELERSRAELAVIEANIKALSDEYAIEERKKEDLAEKLQESRNKLMRAKNLIDGLGSEKDLWINNVRDLKDQLVTILGDILLSSAYTVYMGPLTTQYRQRLLGEWLSELGTQNIAHTEDFQLNSIMGDPIKIREWNLATLPTDSLSVENGIITTSTDSFPLLVDPQGQVNKWLLNIEAKNNIQVIDINSPTFIRSLENTVQFGTPLLVEGVLEEIDPVLFPLLAKQVFSVEGQQVIYIGDKTVPFNPNFRMYLTTKLSNPNLAPETFAKINLVNFTVTREGLEEQFLATVVNHERIDLERQRVELMESIASQKKQVHDLDEQILQMLYNAQGDILADQKLTDALTHSKITSDEVMVRLAEAETVNKNINNARSQYLPVAMHASVLYTTVMELVNIDHMYQFSLDWFTDLFSEIMETAPKSDDIEERIDTLKSMLTLSVYQDVCRFIFVRHKLLFSLLLAVRIQQFDQQIDPAQYMLFVEGTSSFGGTEQIDLPHGALEWLSHESWSSLCACERAGVPLVRTSISSHTDEWKNVVEGGCESALPDDLDDVLSHFQRLMVSRALRPDKIREAIQRYVSNVLGPEFIEPPQFDIERTFASSTPTKPIVFLLSPGTDPTGDILEFAAKTGMSRRTSSLSLGAGMDNAVKTAVTQAVDRGDWVVLQNCHLVVSWLPELEKIIREIPADRVHLKFRLWLTTSPCREFPVSILQSSVKVTNEPPTGVRPNLIRAFSKVSPEVLSENIGNILWHKLTYGVCFLHATMVERFKFGRLGWNKAYEFNQADLNICLKMVDFLLEEVPNLSQMLEQIRYLSLECMYGGHVTEPFDRRLLTTMGESIFTLDIVKSAHKLSESGVYRCPEPGSFETYIESIRSLPINDHPEVFGLHENADIAKATNEALALFSTLLLLQPRVSAKSADDGSGNGSGVLTIAQNLLSQVPSLFDVEALNETHPVSYAKPYNSIILKEVENYNKLLRVVRNSLNELINTQTGKAPSSPVIDQMCTELMRGNVPERWKANSFLSLKPLNSWFADLQKRIKFVSDWIKNGEPKVFWLPGLFQPTSFLTGVMQKYARTHKVPVDSVTFTSEVLTEIEVDSYLKTHTDVLVVSGLFLEGARWDTRTGSLAECKQKELRGTLPPISLKPCQEKDAASITGTYRCPLYITLERFGKLTTTGQSSNFVTSLSLPCGIETEQHWVKRGTAMFCQLSN